MRISSQEDGLALKMQASAQTRHRRRQQAQRVLCALTLSAFTCGHSGCLPAAAEQSQASTGYAAARAAYDLCVQGVAQMKSGDYAGARDTLLKAVGYDPSPYSGNAHSNLGECYRQLHDYQQALTQETLALKFDPKDQSALYTTALTYRDMGDSDRAIAVLNRCSSSGDANSGASVQKQIKETRVFKNLIEASKCINSQQDARAIALLESAAKDDPSSNSASVHAQLAYALRRSGHSQAAIPEAKKALALNPNDYHTMYCLGIAEGDMANFGEGIQWIKRYTDAEPDPTQRAQALASVKMFEQDKRQFDEDASRESNYLDQRSEAYGRWSKAHQKLRIFIGSGNGVRGYRKNFDSFITTALDTWCLASKSKLDYDVVTSPDDADIAVRWTTDPLPVTEDHPGVQPAGLTNYTMEGAQALKTATISIRTVDPFNPARTLQDGECAPVCLHEVGHSLGLAHSTCIKDTMYYRGSGAQTGHLTARDQATIAMLYDDYPATAFKMRTKPATVPTFLPPPAFMPPKPQDTDKLTPPMFLPPPIEKQKKLVPPMFTPPPISSGKPSSPASSPAVPTFLPPPVTHPAKSKAPDQPFFIPPPK